MVRSRKLCCHANATIHYIFIVVGIDVAVNNIKVFRVATEKQQCVPFALFSSYEVFRTAVNTKTYSILRACLLA